MTSTLPFTGINDLLTDLEAGIASLRLPGYPANLYDPIRYFMQLGGKRFRPVLHRLAAGALGAPEEQARRVALAIEVFHNFTLVHDDIMDKAPLRRGQATVHEKWNANVAILSGDAMLVVVYQILAGLPADILAHILPRFNETALGVVEGQQMDMDFETDHRASEADYKEMIRLKTAVLVGFSLEAAGILAGLSEAENRALAEAGEKIGVGFQLYDDYLDAFGDAAQVGKQPGGDILARKKTILFHLAMEDSVAAPRLSDLFYQEERMSDAQVSEVLELFDQTGAKDKVKAFSEGYFREGIAQLEAVLGENEWSAALARMAQQLMYRIK